MHYRFPDLAILIRALALLATLAAAGCAGAYRWDAGSANPAEDQVYEVQRGDTLYSIAWRYGLDYRTLATRNGIGADFTIYPGQKLALVAEARAPQSTPVNVSPSPSRVSEPAPPLPQGAWRWPASGAVIAKFGAPNATGKGITIGGVVGDPILAAADGKVVYSGSGLIGYGKIIIVKHSEEYLSAYGHNDTIYVREGEEVRQGDRIASMGTGPGNKPLLHFEIRLNGEAVDPLDYLPSR
ncbi:MAG TPA: peptidoglycan DD-metalloendopeptidase family protein [Gammaproteobacteria bacterium]